MKPRLLVIELWGLGDVAMATPFLRAAVERYEVTVVAKSYAIDLQKRFWPGVTVVPFVAPWTPFRGKYRLLSWNWEELFALRRHFKNRVDVAVSARWDPRDHVLMAFLGAKRRAGFPRTGSSPFLTDPLPKPNGIPHRYEFWRIVGERLGIQMPPMKQAIQYVDRPAGTQVLIHSGASQTVKAWPIPKFRALAEHLRKQGYQVAIACDPTQRSAWELSGESGVETPASIPDLLELIDRAGAFIGNDSGPGHVAAIAGVPTFSFFGPAHPEGYMPIHSASEVLPGKPCPFKPCRDYCRQPRVICLHDVTEAEAFGPVENFVQRHLRSGIPTHVTPD